ncbi:hypothetical protein [Methylotenera sp.]|uniref:hypothetical protein n=1 Tax=Methylotenera sp. TaxID=2051956 RepID=UPI002487952F|nr:hypothetical protein [Methylotenera sp.]MDI1299785.1 hypothetical protein [Methylotenera sp.]
MSANTAKVVNDKELAIAFGKVSKFINPNQRTAMLSNCYGEEGEHFVNTFKSLGTLIDEMPVTHGQEGKGKKAIAYLHYFVSNCDWYVTEKDIEGGVLQAFGYCVVSNSLESGRFRYINITELLLVGAELDLYFTPKALDEILSEICSEVSA